MKVLWKELFLSKAVLLLGAAMTAPASAQSCDTICTDGETCLSAAVYPYVPDMSTFTSAICSAWEASGQTEKLYLIADENVWDGGYDSNPVYTNGSGTQTPIDVFVYDAMYLEYWKTKTVEIPASQITDQADFVPYAQTALKLQNNDMYALPMLGCTNIMFYRAGDAGMEAVTTLSAFESVNSAGIYISPVPWGMSGAMMNMAGKTTIGVNYMVKGYLDTGNWPSMSQLDPSIIQSLAGIAETASYYNALTGAVPPLAGVEDQYVRAGYFSEGYGRTSIGFSESMSQMSDATRQNLRLRAFPWTDDTSSPNMFYADVAGVNSQSPYLANSGTLPFVLANIMTEQATLQNAIAPAGQELSYLFPARTSVLNTLAGQDPLYAQMSEILNDKTTLLVSMPTTDRTAFHSFGGSVQTAVLGAFSGHCDLESTSFPGSNSEAPSICTPLCQNAGGWVGSWTNEAPPAWPAYSACGCTQCVQSSPLPQSVQDEEPTTMIVTGPALKRYNRN
ncbi:thiamine pyridinylase [Roseibium denhamense]|uniref:Carbohydrate ABC transporter substrate-binding protein, CUT1 family n=1 Tax=Roseibium denhamense TaxID=76305 RepID=A0ABY1P3B2_9HYPH|nr:thiamine pyridinylase [Roseibium denhamense]SMP25215.1 carbohydrate ABC transporter substrate-binding protein, CUT1 family [Roseibium denhamense]